jgi:hypothetical protein
MFASALLYTGLVAALSGLLLTIKPIARLGVSTRRRALGLAGAGCLAAGVAFGLPVSESRAARPQSALDRFVPVWQFNEVHERRIAAPPSIVFDAIKRVRPDEILLFRALIAIRGLGRPLPPEIADASERYASLMDIATHTTFIYLADDPPRELVVGTIVGRPRGVRTRVAPELFAQPPPGFALAAMDYIVRPDGAGSLVSTETRVFASGIEAERRFAIYWRIIYPGSALIRRMSLRAIDRRAVSSPPR